MLDTHAADPLFLTVMLASKHAKASVCPIKTLDDGLPIAAAVQATPFIDC